MLPRINHINKTEMQLSEFRGLNHNSYLEDSEFYDMKNMTGDYYPFASPRNRRGVYKSGDEYFGTYIQDAQHTLHCNGITTKQGFLFCEGDESKNRLYYKSNSSDTFLHIGDLTPGEKQFVSLGAYVCIFPDKKYFWSILFEKTHIPVRNEQGEIIGYETDTAWLENHGIDSSAPYFGSLEANVQTTHQVRIRPCNVYGEKYKIDIIAASQPSEAYEIDGTIWLDIENNTTSKLMQYSESYSGWIEIATSYLRIEFPDCGSGFLDLFNDYDGVELTGFPAVLNDFNGAAVLYKVNEENSVPYFVIPGYVNLLEAFDISQDEHSGSYDPYVGYEGYLGDSDYYLYFTNTTNGFKINRKVPDMDFVCEQDNRLWGCSNDNHEIYISKQGSPFNFNCFIGLATDSDVITIGSDGDFTGCISHLGYVLFFKEDRVHKIYGTKPTNYQVTEVMMRGVQKGCFKSMQICNETLFYKSKTGVMMYQGSLPEEISAELGEEIYTDAVAGVYKNKYYISMKDSSGQYHLFAYNTELGLWHKEDNTRFRDTLTVLDELYYLDSEHRLCTIGGKGNTFTVHRLKPSNNVETSQYEDKEYSVQLEEKISWEAETGDLYDGSIDHKYISRLRILLTLYEDTEINVFLKYDNEDKWQHVFNQKYKYSDTVRDTFNIPIIPRRARRMKMKITGEGNCLIQAIAKSIEQGSELI